MVHPGEGERIALGTTSRSKRAFSFVIWLISALWLIHDQSGHLFFNQYPLHIGFGKQECHELSRKGVFCSHNTTANWETNEFLSHPAIRFILNLY